MNYSGGARATSHTLQLRGGERSGSRGYHPQHMDAYIEDLKLLLKCINDLYQ